MIFPYHLIFRTLYVIMRSKFGVTFTQTMAEAVLYGAKILDVLLWFGAGCLQGVNLMVYEEGPEDAREADAAKENRMIKQIEALLYTVMFYLLEGVFWRGSYPASEVHEIGSDVAAFLENRLCGNLQLSWRGLLLPLI